MKIAALRLQPDADLKDSLHAFTVDQDIQAGFIVTTVGSLKQVRLRLADQPTSTLFELYPNSPDSSLNIQAKYPRPHY